MHRHLRAVLLTAVVASTTAACQMGAGADSADTTSPAQQLGIFEPGQLPNPCDLVSTEAIGTLISAEVSEVEGEPVEKDGKPMLFRTCMWGDPDQPAGAIGVQIGVPDLDGHDVVESRTVVMQPYLTTNVGEDGRETMNVGELPTGGAKGATIFFRHNGYSVMVGHVGPGAATGSVEEIAHAIIASLDALP